MNEGMHVSKYYSNDLGIVCTTGVNDLRHDVADAECNIRHDVKDAEANVRREVAKAEADIRGDVKDAECNIRHDVKEAECDIRHDIKTVECNLKDTLNINNLNLMNRLCEIEKQGIRSEFEAKLTTKDVAKELKEESRHVTERLSDKLLGLEDKLEECCCELKERFSGARIEALEDLVAELRAKVTVPAVK